MIAAEIVSDCKSNYRNWPASSNYQNGDDPYICDIREQYKKHQHNNETSGPFGEASSSIPQGILGIGDIVVARSKTVFKKHLFLCDLFSICMLMYITVTVWFHSLLCPQISVDFTMLRWKIQIQFDHAKMKKMFVLSLYIIFLGIGYMGREYVKMMRIKVVRNLY